jgi:hypothetical protein
MFIGQHPRMFGGKTRAQRARAQRLLRLACFFIVVLPVRLACCEFVRFDFAGIFSGGATGTYSLFGMAVPRNAVVRGSFRYDTESSGSTIDAGTKAFHLTRPGGFTLDIHNGAIRLSASEYSVTVANDFGGTPTALDLFSVDYDSRWSPPPTPLIVNDVPWSGSTAFLKVSLSWPSTTFIDADEPKLTSTRPLTPSPGVTAFVGSSPTPRMFTVDSISTVTPEPDAICFVWSTLLLLAARARQSRVTFAHSFAHSLPKVRPDP